MPASFQKKIASVILIASVLSAFFQHIKISAEDW
jgi:hypothetical protein